jgi:hypothetical protein
MTAASEPLVDSAGFAFARLVTTPAGPRVVVPQFGVATACGLGRRPPETIPEVLRLHAAVAVPVGQR